MSPYTAFGIIIRKIAKGLGIFVGILFTIPLFFMVILMATIQALTVALQTVALWLMIQGIKVLQRLRTRKAISPYTFFGIVIATTLCIAFWVNGLALA